MLSNAGVGVALNRSD